MAPLDTTTVYGDCTEYSRDPTHSFRDTKNKCMLPSYTIVFREPTIGPPCLRTAHHHKRHGQRRGTGLAAPKRQAHLLQLHRREARSQSLSSRISHKTPSFDKSMFLSARMYHAVVVDEIACVRAQQQSHLYLMAMSGPQERTNYPAGSSQPLRRARSCRQTQRSSATSLA